MWKRSAHDRIDRLEYSLQRRVRTDRHVSATEVVVDRPDYSNEV